MLLFITVLFQYYTLSICNSISAEQFHHFIFLAAFTEHTPEPPGIPLVLPQEIFTIRESSNPKSNYSLSNNPCLFNKDKHYHALFFLSPCKDTNPLFISLPSPAIPELTVPDSAQKNSGDRSVSPAPGNSACSSACCASESRGL